MKTFYDKPKSLSQNLIKIKSKNIFLGKERSYLSQTFVTEVSNVFGSIQLSYYNLNLTFDEAIAHCQTKQSSLVLVNSTEVQFALKSLVILKNLENDGVWEEKLWTELLLENKNFSYPESVASGLMTISLQDDGPETQNQSFITTLWHNASKTAKHNFVCREGN